MRKRSVVGALVIVLAGAVLLVTGCSMGPPQECSLEQTLQRLQHAREYCDRGDEGEESNQAIAEYTKGIELNPYGGYYYLRRGMCYMGGRAGLHDTDGGKVVWTMGRDDERIKDCDRAIGDYTRAIELYFYNSPYADGGKWESWLAWAQLARAYGFRGMCYQGKEEYRLAIDDLTKAIEYLKWGPDPVMVEIPESSPFFPLSLLSPESEFHVSEGDVWSFWIFPLPLTYDRTRFLLCRSACYEELEEYSLAAKDLEEVVRVSDLYRNHSKQVAQYFDHDASLAQELLKKLESKGR